MSYYLEKSIPCSSYAIEYRGRPLYISSICVQWKKQLKNNLPLGLHKSDTIRFLFKKITLVENMEEGLER